MPAIDAATTIMELLRDSTSELHKSAENSRLQKQLVNGDLPFDRYADYMEQLWFVHRAIERALASAEPRDGRLAGMADAAAMHVRHLENDLAEMGRDIGAIVPTEAALELTHAIERDAESPDPVLVAGHFYVLEGSMNGNSYIAKKVGTIYELKPDAGLTYLYSYGRSQRRKWNAFKQAMNEHHFDKTEREGLVERARSVFHAIRAIADELDAR
ncbi:MAG: biliverdin-producing heme oxygenase [Planctomycetota bacterium]